MTSDVVIIGGGAAGLFCGAVAGANGRSVIILEHNPSPGKKIRISGGGRCNFTNVNTAPQNFISNNPHFVRSALARYTAQDFIDLVDRYGIKWHEKTLGQLFCDNSAQQIIDMLVQECSNVGAQLQCNASVSSVSKEADTFTVITSEGDVTCSSVVVASGGLSIPKLGATGVGYDIARSFSIPIIDPQPALVPVICSKPWQQRWGALAGVSIDSTVTANGVDFRENLLFTHRGLTGPSVLQASSYLPDVVQEGLLRVDLLPNDSVDSLFPIPNQEPRSIGNVLATVIAKRFVQAWTQHDLTRRVDQTSLAELTEIVEAFKNWEVRPVETEGYLKAEVTRGGVDTNALSSKTMECTTVPGLFFIGEVVDVTGWLGGYNFQWAWSSGYAAGLAV